jgi:hypothetical protein
MKKFIVTLSLSTITLWAQTGLAPPRLGFIAATDHSLRPVLGLSGNLLLGSPTAEDVVSAAWSGYFGLVKSSSSLMAFDVNHMLASVDDVAGPALFAFNLSGVPAFALLPQTGTLYTWTGKAFHSLAFPADWLGGQTLAIASPQPGQISLIVQRNDGLWLEEMSTGGGGLVQSALPGIQAPVLLQDDGALLYMDRTALVIRDRKGNERRIETGVWIGEMNWMGSGWLQLVESNHGRQYAVRTTAGSENISQIPEAH